MRGIILSCGIKELLRRDIGKGLTVIARVQAQVVLPLHHLLKVVIVVRVIAHKSILRNKMFRLG